MDTGVTKNRSIYILAQMIRNLFMTGVTIRDSRDVYCTIGLNETAKRLVNVQTKIIIIIVYYTKRQHIKVHNTLHILYRPTVKHIQICEDKSTQTTAGLYYDRIIVLTKSSPNYSGVIFASESLADLQGIRWLWRNPLPSGCH